MARATKVRIKDCPRVHTLAPPPPGYTLHAVPDGTVALWDGKAYIQFDSLDTALDGLEVGVMLLKMGSGAAPTVH